MPVSQELLNTTWEDFRGPCVNTFAQNTPLRATLYKKGKVSSDGGAFVERGLMTGSPARATGIFNGDEVLDRTRRKKTGKFRVDFHRVVISINIPQKELNQNRGKAGALQLIQIYPKAVMDGIVVDCEKYLLTGKSAGMASDTSELLGFLSLNGQFSSGEGTGVENGLLDFATPATQTDTVQNVAKNFSDTLYNQYGDIGTWASDGIQVMRKVYRTAAQFSGKPNGGPDLMIMDDDTYGNYQNSKLDIVRLQKVQDSPDKPGSNLLQDVFGLAGVYSSILIDLANDFTGVAVDGVTYGLNTDFAEIVQLEAMNISKFADAGQDQDGQTCKLAWHEAMIFQKLAAHFCISGGSR